MEEQKIKTKFKILKNKISPFILRSLKGMAFKHMTDIQAAVLPKALQGLDVVATAKTGSGKTIAFLIPAIEQVMKCTEESIRGV